MINWARVSELRDEVGEEDFDEVVEMFIEEVEEVMVRLISAPNPETYEEDLHFLKGSALSLGFSAFSDLCQIGEKAAANGQAETIDLEKVFETYAESKTEFLNKPSDSAAA